jgi:hypothetical protein
MIITLAKSKMTMRDSAVRSKTISIIVSVGHRSPLIARRFIMARPSRTRRQAVPPARARDLIEIKNGNTVL